MTIIKFLFLVLIIFINSHVISDNSIVSLEKNLLKKLCLSSNILRDETALSKDEFIIKYPPNYAFTSCYFYLLDGGQEKKALNLFFESAIHLSSGNQKDQLLIQEKLKEIISLARNHSDVSLYASEVLMAFSNDDDEVNKTIQKLIENGHPNTLQDALLLYVNDKEKDYKFFDRELLLNKISKSNDLYTKYLGSIFLDEIGPLPFNKDEIKILLNNYHWVHAHLADKLDQKGELEIAAFQKVLYALRGDDQAKLQAAYSLAISEKYWKGGYLAQQILNTIEDNSSLREDAENDKKYINTSRLIYFNPVFKKTLEGERSSFSTYFPEFLVLMDVTSVVDLLSTTEQARELERDSDFVTESYKKFLNKSFMNIDEKISSAATALLSKNEFIAIQGLELLLDIGDEDIRAFEHIRYLYDFYSTVISDEGINFLPLRTMVMYEDGSINAEEFLRTQCHRNTLFTKAINCIKFLQESKIHQLSFFSSKSHNEGLNLNDIKNLKEIKVSLNHSKGFKNYILGGHFYDSDNPAESKLFFEDSRKYEYFPAIGMLKNYYLSLGDYEEALNLGFEMITQLDSLSAYRFSNLVENRYIKETDYFYLTGGEEVWDKIAYDLGSDVAALNQVLQSQFDGDRLEEQIYKLDLLKRKDFSLINNGDYYKYRLEIALQSGDLGEARMYRNALTKYCKDRECSADIFNKQFLWMEDKKNLLEQVLRIEGEDFLEGYDIDFDQWSWIVADAELKNLDTLFLNIIREIHTEGRSSEYIQNYLTYYMTIAWSNRSCDIFSEVLTLFEEYESVHPQDFYMFEMYVAALSWGSICGELDKKYLNIVSDLSEALLNFYLSSGQNSVAARGIRMLYSQQGFEDKAYDLSLSLLDKLKEDNLYSVMTGRQSSFVDQSQTLSFYKFFSDVIYQRYSNNLMNMEEFLELMITIHSLSSFSSIAQTLFQEKIISSSEKDSLGKSVARLTSTRRSIDNSVINNIEISSEDLDSKLLQISKEKEKIRKDLKELKGAVHQENFIENLRAGLDPEELLVFYVDGVQVIYKIEISKEKYFFSTIKREHLSDWKQIKIKLASFENIYQIPEELLLISHWLLPSSDNSFNSINFFPSSSLLGFPFKSLVLRENESVSPEEIFQSNLFLIQKSNIRVTPSVFNFLRKKENSKDVPKKKKLLALGDPLFNSLEINDIEFILDKYRSTEGAIKSISALAPLPESGEEVQKISEYFTESSIFLGKEASIDSILSLNLNEYSHIVIATHAIAPFEILNIPSSGLVLSPSTDDIGLLTPFIISQLSLDADLVVLSACSTSSSEYSDNEIYTGLVQAFMEAGAKSVLFTDWKVETNASSAISQNTIKHLVSGLDKEEALSESIRDYLQQNEGVFRHPSFWASFDIFY